MAPLGSMLNANSRTLKRPYTAEVSNITQSHCATESTSDYQWARSSRARVGSVASQGSLDRTRPSTKDMSIQSGPSMQENHTFSFMSVYDVNANRIETLQNPSRPLENVYPDQPSKPELPHPQSLNRQPENESINPIILHQHHESTSTTSESTDSSPTTTISTIDSSSLSDPSPSSSPESPVTLVPLSSFSGSTFGMDSYQALKMKDNNLIRAPLLDERPMTSPSPRKFKNPKSLALNLNPAIDNFQAAGPVSPSFIKPPPLKARKKPSLLSLNTGAANRLALSPEPIGSPSIPSMLQRRSLKHSISSPQILATPGFGPAGGMTLGERKPLGPSRFKDLSLATNTFTISEDHHEAPTGVQMATRVPGVSVGGDSFDRPPTGEDAKSPSYPEGPILMHEPSVHLYSEPKLDEAMKFDVVINVAREVKNPFETDFSEASEAASKFKSEPVTLDDSIPDTAMSMLSFQTAFEMQPPSSTESSPTTPKPSIEAKRPEYIHVPWDHNTDVKDELWDLCQLIEARTKEGKKVLVHCQQGASRSATLIIAYGMYTNQDMSATEAYAMAQSKSRWVNPNMSLLFSLNDFKKIIDKKKAETESTPSVRKSITKHRPTLSAVGLESPSTMSRARGNSTPSAAARDKALSRVDDSPIPTQSAIERLGSFDFGFDQMTISGSPPQVDAKENDTSTSRFHFLPPPVPLRRAPSPPKSNLDEQIRPSMKEARTVVQELPPSISNEWDDLLSPRITEMTSNPILSFSRSLNVSEIEEPPTPSLFSPRAFEFPRSTFFPLVDQPAPANAEDPRSPPTKGEAPITRSIDDVL